MPAVEKLFCAYCRKDGKVQLVLVAADICGISQTFKVEEGRGMAYGTESIPKVSKFLDQATNITTAKMLVYGEVISTCLLTFGSLVFAEKM